MVIPNNKKLIESCSLTKESNIRSEFLEKSDDTTMGKNKKYIVKITADDSAIAWYSIILYPGFHILLF